MNRQDFSQGKRVWNVACAKCSKFKGFCKCTAANIIVMNVDNVPTSVFELQEPSWIYNLFNSQTPIVRREHIGMAVANPEGVTHYTLRSPQEEEDREESDEWVEDEM